MSQHIYHSDVVLDGTNYLAWKLTLWRLLNGLRVLGHVDGTITMPVAPLIPDSSSSSLDDTFERERERERERDYLISNYLAWLAKEFTAICRNKMGEETGSRACIVIQ